MDIYACIYVNVNRAKEKKTGKKSRCMCVFHFVCFVRIVLGGFSLLMMLDHVKKNEGEKK